MNLPAHKCGLYLTHNEHRDYYEPIAEFIQDREVDSFSSPEEMQKAIETNELWTLQWYPDTPVGFYRVAGATLEHILKRANEIAGPRPADPSRAAEERK